MRPVPIGFSTCQTPALKTNHTSQQLFRGLDMGNSVFGSQTTLRTSDTVTIKITPLRSLPRTGIDRMFQVAFRGIGKLSVINFPTKHQLLLVLKTPEIVQRRRWCTSWRHHDFIGMKKRTPGQKCTSDLGLGKIPTILFAVCLNTHRQMLK